jgi:GNT-I family
VKIRLAEEALADCPATDRDLLAKLYQLTTENIRLTAENEYLVKQLRSVPSIAGEPLPLSRLNEAEHTIRALPLQPVSAPTAAVATPNTPTHHKIGVLILCHKRPEYLRRALDSVLARKPDHFPLFVSQDGVRNKEIWEMLNSPPYQQRLTAWQITKRTIPAKRVSSSSYYYIANHYGKALGKLFSETDLDSVIILEGGYSMLCGVCVMCNV